MKKNIEEMFFYFIIDKKLYNYHYSKKLLFMQLTKTLIESIRIFLHIPIPSKIQLWYMFDFLNMKI